MSSEVILSQPQPTIVTYFGQGLGKIMPLGIRGKCQIWGKSIFCILSPCSQGINAEERGPYPVCATSLYKEFRGVSLLSLELEVTESLHPVDNKHKIIRKQISLDLPRIWSKTIIALSLSGLVPKIWFALGTHHLQ